MYQRWFHVGVVIEKLTVKAGSALVIVAAEGANVVIKSLTVDNAGWDFAPLADGEDHPEVLAIRGFTVDRRDTKTTTFAADNHIVEDTTHTTTPKTHRVMRKKIDRLA